MNVTSKDGRPRPSPKHLEVIPIYLLMNTSIASNFMFLRPSLGKVRKAFKNKLSLFFPIHLYFYFLFLVECRICLLHLSCFNLLASMSDMGWILLSFLLAGYYSCRSTPLRSWQKHNHVIWVYTEWVVKIY